MMEKIFVYGTLKVGEFFAEQFEPYRTTVIPAKVAGFRIYLHKGQMFPLIVPSEGDQVIGEYHIYTSDEIIDAFDRIEGYDPVKDAGMYLRRKVRVELLGFPAPERPVYAWAYIWNGSLEGAIPLQEKF